MPPLRYSVIHQDSRTSARIGRLELPHGVVDTPAFMPVGTQGSVKAVTPEQLAGTGARLILANTYHLALRPGADVVREAGGLHRFMGWDGPILTDSGGFQVFSLASLRRVDDDGVTFRSHIDGAELRLTPESSISIQNRLGADAIMAFDECAPHPASREDVARAVERTSRWAERSLRAHERRDEQALFGIVQGGVHDDLRAESAARITELPFDGFAIGGVSVGEGPEAMRRAVDVTCPLLPAGSPRYLMGVGGPIDIVDMALRGIDLFDCVIPTRHARNASLFTRQGVVRIRNEAHARSHEPLEPGCDCYTCRRFTRSYLRHLYTRGEILACVLGTIHNLRFFHRLVADLAAAIRAGNARELQAEFHARRQDFGLLGGESETGEEA